MSSSSRFPCPGLGISQNVEDMMVALAFIRHSKYQPGCPG
jgi:hypothetical protein